MCSKCVLLSARICTEKNVSASLKSQWRCRCFRASLYHLCFEEKSLYFFLYNSLILHYKYNILQQKQRLEKKPRIYTDMCCRTLFQIIINSQPGVPTPIGLNLLDQTKLTSYKVVETCFPSASYNNIILLI